MRTNRFVIGMEGGSEDCVLTYGAAVILEKGTGDGTYKIINPVTDRISTFLNATAAAIYLREQASEGNVSLISENFGIPAHLCLVDDRTNGIIKIPDGKIQPFYMLRTRHDSQAHRGVTSQSVISYTLNSKYTWWLFESLETLTAWGKPVAQALMQQREQLRHEACILDHTIVTKDFRASRNADD